MERAARSILAMIALAMVGCASAPARSFEARAPSTPDEGWVPWPTRIDEVDDATALFAGDEPCVLRSSGQLDCIRSRETARTAAVVEALFAYHHAEASAHMARWKDIQFASRTSQEPTNIWTWTHAPSPLDPPLLPPRFHAEQVRVEASGGCAILDAGEAVACWGMGHSVDAPLVARMPERERAVEVGVSVERDPYFWCLGGDVGGQLHACARLESGRVACWGWNFVGQLGDGTRRDSNTPVHVRGIADARSIAVGMHHGCALHADGSVSCWGYGIFGQLGDGGDISRESPVRVVAVEDAVALSAGEVATCALGRDGRPRCWGDALSFGVNDPRGVPLPQLLDVPEPLVELAAGDSYLCGRSAAGRVYCGGYY